MPHGPDPLYGFSSRGPRRSGTGSRASRHGGPRSPPLILPAGTSTLWAWIATRAAPDGGALRQAMDHAAPGVRVVLGPPRAGVSGFRRSHAAALAAQRLVAGNAEVDRLTTYDDVEVVALASRDEEQLSEFIVSTLGPLCGTDPALVLDLPHARSGCEEVGPAFGW
ncbi:hypothetical protein AB0A76_33745 [Streptomyces exfoliatus]|uniref:CdaR GGDEF-like domain-containing protein n=1 Tax=Streptomyces exfoliatus TaxID=1905 RepID=A0ABV3D6J6_STREX